MKHRGFIELQLLLIIVIAVGAMGGVGWFIHNIREGEREKLRQVNAQERAARTEMISGLAVDLGKAQENLQKERTANEGLRLQNIRDREGRLNEFVSKDTSCIRVGWVRYTNAAAAGVPLGLRPGPGVAQALAGVGTDTVASTVARNYDKYHDCKAAVAGILKEFDTKRQVSNERIDRINKRVKDAERKLQ